MSPYRRKSMQTCPTSHSEISKSIQRTFSFLIKSLNPLIVWVIALKLLIVFSWKSMHPPTFDYMVSSIASSSSSDLWFVSGAARDTIIYQSFCWPCTDRSFKMWCHRGSSPYPVARWAPTQTGLCFGSWSLGARSFWCSCSRTHVRNQSRGDTPTYT